MFIKSLIILKQSILFKNHRKLATKLIQEIEYTIKTVIELAKYINKIDGKEKMLNEVFEANKDVIENDGRFEKIVFASRYQHIRELESFLNESFHPKNLPNTNTEIFEYPDIVYNPLTQPRRFSFRPELLSNVSKMSIKLSNKCYPTMQHVSRLQNYTDKYLMRWQIQNADKYLQNYSNRIDKEIDKRKKLKFTKKKVLLRSSSMEKKNNCQCQDIVQDKHKVKYYPKPQKKITTKSTFSELAGSSGKPFKTYYKEDITQKTDNYTAESKVKFNNQEREENKQIMPNIPVLSQLIETENESSCQENDSEENAQTPRDSEVGEEGTIRFNENVLYVQDKKKYSTQNLGETSKSSDEVELLKHLQTISDRMYKAGNETNIKVYKKMQMLYEDIATTEVLRRKLPNHIKGWIAELKLTCINKLRLIKDLMESNHLRDKKRESLDLSMLNKRPSIMEIKDGNSIASKSLTDLLFLDWNSEAIDSKGSFIGSSKQFIMDQFESCSDSSSNSAKDVLKFIKHLVSYS